MSAGNLLPVESRCVREPKLELEHMGQMESLFAVPMATSACAAILTKPNPTTSPERPGTFLSGFYKGIRCRIPKVIMGTRESGQTIINITSGR